MKYFCLSVTLYKAIKTTQLTGSQASSSAYTSQGLHLRSTMRQEGNQRLGSAGRIKPQPGYLKTSSLATDSLGGLSPVTSLSNLFSHLSDESHWLVPASSNILVFCCPSDCNSLFKDTYIEKL